MKKLIFLLCIIIIPAVLNSQEKDKEYREFLDEIQKDFNSMEERSNFEFENFIDSMNIEWLQLLKEAEKEFSDLLSGSFREYTSEIPEKLPEVKKPEQITNYKVTPGVSIDTDSIKRTPFIKGITEVFLFHELPAGISSGTLLSASLKFLDTVFTIQFDPKLKELPEISHPDPGRIKKCYDFLLNTDYQPVLNQILLLCDQLNLNDWDYFCLLNEFSLSVFEEPNAQKVIAWFLLIQSNYKAKIGYSNDNLSVLLAIDQTLYDIPWFNINGERYYAFKCDGKKIKTYDIEHFKGHKYLSVFHARPFLLEGNKSERIVTFPYDGKDYSIALEYDQNTVNYYTDFPGMDVDYYFSLPVSQTFKESVENRIAPFLINKSRSDALRFLLSLVQYGFDYKTDEEQFNKEKYMVPEEVLFYNYSDCDDRTILFSYLVKSLLNLDVIALDFKGHICSAVDVTNTGACTGKEVVQLYVAPKGGTIIRPVRELKAFEKTELAPGETKTVTFELDSRAYAYWNTEIHDWHVETGAYEIQICRNAQEVLLSEEVQVESETVLPKVYTLNSTMGEIMADPKGKAILEQAMGEMEGMDGESTEEQMQDDSGVINDEMMAAMMEAMPLRQMLSFVPGVTKEALNQLVAALNAAE